ncbi:hypothetical protein HQN60_10575 [Deefgea piscis]|uniref:Copper resistance protein CopC n=1 Tax=Deefgea piscis TaxID=2739061 RepID=A0A6M8SUB7_9NEIS|nr:hypothetical protein [Deefgea piscis]QKJ67106.1 hypothetical protein HQN60_10575 [Deefgea piscis]
MKRITVLICGLILNTAAWAHGDDDHSAAPQTAATQASLTSVPSAESASSDFEVLAQMDGEILTVYLNRFADNRPVSDASLEVESGAFKAKLTAVASGIYQAPAAPLAKTGEHALTLTLFAGEQSDLLGTTLNVAAPTLANAPHIHIQTWLWIGGGVAALLLLLVALRRRGGNKL